MDMFTEEQKEELRQGVKDAAEAVEDVAKYAAEVAKPATDAVKKAAKKAAKKAKPATDAVKKATAEAVKKAPTKPVVYVQYAAKEVDTNDLIAQARAIYKEAGNRAAVRSLRVYVKPEELAAYFVINDEFQGKIDL